MKLNYKRTFMIGLAFMSISAFWQLYDSLVPKMLDSTFGIKETATGAIMALDNVLALFLLPFFGALSDRVDTRLGKRTPFILFGTFVAVISMMVLPLANEWVNFPLFFIALGMVLLAMSTYRSPAVALMPDLTPKPLRSQANAIINLMGAFGGIFSLLMISLLVPRVDKPNYTLVFLAVALFMVVAVAALVNTVKEKKLSKELADELSDEMEAQRAEDEDAATSEAKKGSKLPKDVFRSMVFLLASIFFWFTAYNAVTTAFSRYAEKVWGLKGGSFANSMMVAMGAAIIAFIPIGFVSSRIGRKKTIIAGIIMITLSYLCGFLFFNYSPWINVVFAITGIGWASINVNSYPMVVEMSRGADIGKYTGIYYTFSMIAQIFTPIFSGFLLEKIHYRTLFPYAVVFSLLSLLTMLNVRHGDSKPPVKEDIIANFDIAD